MKALILVAGKGARLKPLTNTIPKSLLAVANNPVLFYALDKIKDAGITDIAVVISPETGHLIKRAIGNGSRWGINITYIVQTEALGLAHAVKSAHEFLQDSPFLMFLGDNLLEDSIAKHVLEFNNSTLDALLLLKEVSDPRQYGVVELDSSGAVVSLTEKPREPKSNLAIAGVYLFTAAIHQAIAEITPSWRGELEITDAIEKLLRQGKAVAAHVLTGWWLDIGKKDDLLDANRRVLDISVKPKIAGDVDSRSKIVGNVEIGKRTRVEKSLIRGPVSIGEDCRIDNSSIGPFVSIAAGTTIENSSVENSIIMDNCTLLAIHCTKDIMTSDSQQR